MRAHCCFLDGLDGQDFLSSFKTKVKEYRSRGVRNACQGSHFRYKFTYYVGDSKQMTRDMLGIMGNWMGLN